MATVANFADLQTRAERAAVAPGTAGDHRRSEATRYMSAAAYRDPKFRDRTLATVEDQPYKSLGPNYGCDLGVIVGHCLRARRLARIRDVCLTLLLLVALGVFASGGDVEVVLEDNLGLLLIIATLAVAVVFVEMFVVRFQILGRQVSSSGFCGHGDAVPEAVDCLPKELAQGESHNVIVYGGFTPFVGAGTTIGGWSFAVRTDRGQEDVKGAAEEPQDFALEALYQRVKTEIKALDLPNLRIEPRVYVDGRSVRHDRRFLEKVVSRPKHHLEEAGLVAVREQHGGSARWYLAIEITDWSGELVLTIFVRFQKMPKTLFVEANYSLLTPFKKSLYAIDEEDNEARPSAVLELLTYSALLTLWRLPTTPLRTAAVALQPLSRFSERRAEVRAVERNPGYNYGAEISLRESVADTRYRVYFQRLDHEMRLKTVEKQLLDALVDFLDDHGIDTSGLKERETTILNDGVMISGGSMQARNLAVGEKAQATVGRLQRAAKSVQGKAA